MNYAVTVSKIIPGSSQGFESGFLQDWNTDRVQIEKAFDELELTPEYFCKELWVREPGGRKKILRSEKFNGT